MKKNFNQATRILADLSSKLEHCRDRVIHLKVLSAGHFMSETVVLPLVQLLCDSCMSVHIFALRAIKNVVVDFKQHKSLFTQSHCLLFLLTLLLYILRHSRGRLLEWLESLFDRESVLH
ncbi:armadillo repeat-containing protein 8 [Dorcoceras hygrometricum]|uniref:Armadillo repeat-containing protein 8 n=1 Tax=Dorcoceras hygrometricum TaxID=472368 RepID=A0A2Z7CVQ0_9LAMI|nr:armadillo repeat-containing protein 8 [Dorcoceras hygrometricum]